MSKLKRRRVKDYLLESGDVELAYFKDLIASEISAREAEDLADTTNYKFGLYVGDQLVDTTNLDENSPELAMELFLEFGWDKRIPFHQKDSAYTGLIEEKRGM